MSEPRIFTLDEANAALPRLRVLIAQQMERAAEIRRVQARAAAGSAGARDDDAASLRALMQAYEDGWREVQSMGVVVKDPDTGLCDFYGRVGGEVVWLCWRYGEDIVAHYHALDTGFAGRKPLDVAPTSRKIYN